MTDKKNKKAPAENASVSGSEVDDLNLFIKKKRIQNEALKKIVDNLNSAEQHKNKK